LQRPLAERIVTDAATDNKPNYKMVSTYLFTAALYKAAASADPINNRFVKELIKVFFTLLLKKRFVDIVKCV
jgi:hypothetical protein